MKKVMIKKLIMMFVLCSLSLLFSFPVFAAGNFVKDGYYVIRNANGNVLDINNWSMLNGGNLETYPRNDTTNQIYYVKYRGRGWYTIQVLHSGFYLHKANNGKTDDVHQRKGYGGKNTYWTFESAGSGYYFIRSKAGNYLNNSGNRTDPGNNVITYPKDWTAAGMWELIPVKKPAFEVQLPKYTLPSGFYDRLGWLKKLQVSGTVKSNYPIAKIQLAVYNSAGKIRLKRVETMKVKGIEFRYTFDQKKLSIGRYSYRIQVWNVYGESKITKPSYFYIV